MRKLYVFIILVFLLGIFLYKEKPNNKSLEVLSSNTKLSHWFLLHRQSNIEYLYFGIPGEKDNSQLLNTFFVKTGIPGKNPTPLPELLGRDYWVVVDKVDSSDNSDTAPFFISLDIPVSVDYPFGPSPYLECEGQCDWEIPGYFGLHGVNGDYRKISDEDIGSSGCIRHSDEDITYLYNFLDPKNEEIRYYIEDI